MAGAGASLKRRSAIQISAAAMALWLTWLPCPAQAGAEAGFGPTLTQYAHTNWRVQDGNFGGQAISISQAADGYLWVGTAAGLERYDGASFRRWPLPLDRPVFSVRATDDGSLWVGQGGSLLRIKDGRTTSWVVKGRVSDIHQGPNGDMWIARTRVPAHAGGACRVDGPNLRCVGPEPCNSAATVTHDTSGVLWLAGATAACTWRPDGSGEIVSAEGDAPDLFGVQALLAQRDGSMLVGYMRSGPRAGLRVVSKQISRAFRAEGLNGETLEVSALLTDRRGALWIGTAAAGIYRVARGKVDRFTSADGLSSDTVNALFEDQEGNVWVATGSGIDRFHPRAIFAVTTREGLGGSGGDSVLARRDGSVLVGLLLGVSVLRNGVARRERWTKQVAAYTVTSMLEDHANRIWLGADNDLLRLGGSKPRSIRTPGGEELGALIGLAEDDHHDVWALAAGRPYRLYRIRDGLTAEEVVLPSGRQPTALASGPDGAIWVADEFRDFQVYRSGKPQALKGPKTLKGYHHFVVTQNNDVIISAEEGAFILRDGRWTLLNRARGLPCDSMTVAALDRRGSLWLRGQCGMMIIGQADLRSALRNPQEKLKVRLLDGVDGAQPGAPPFSPAAAASADGRLWFASDNYPLTVDPEHLPTNRLPPPVHIEQIIADHRPYAPGKQVALPPRTRDVEIDYSGLSFVAPQKMRFRYRLLGVDEAWQDVGTRRAAFFMNLKPGRYSFQVTASNNDGVWNETGDTLNFSISPAFYQTLWFQALMVLGLLGLTWVGVWMRLRYVTAEIETRLSERQAERLRIARELHDTLLQGFQGLLMRFQVVADAMPTRSAAKPMMEAVLSRAEEVLVEGRDRVHNLRATEPGRQTLIEDLRKLVLDLERDGFGQIEVRLSGTPRDLEPGVQSEVLAIAKEALTNASQHSRGAKIVCHLTFTGARVRLVCEDDGVGIDTCTLETGGRAGHWGLTGMRERARQIGGRLRIESQPGLTRIEFSLDTRLAYLRAVGSRLLKERGA